jgi:hypothetical protein
MLRMFGLGEGESSEIGWGHVESDNGDINVKSPLLFFAGRHD